MTDPNPQAALTTALGALNRVILGKDREVDRGAFVVELYELLEDDAVCREIKCRSAQLALKAARDDIGTIEKTTRQQVFLRLGTMRRSPSDGGRRGTTGIGRCTRASGIFLHVFSHEQKKKGNRVNLG